MKLLSAHVANYKSVAESGEFALEPDVTCLVGKNESGKTAILEALYRLKALPMGHPVDFDALRDYPRRYYARDKADIPSKTVIGTWWELADEDVAAVEKKFGAGAIKDRRVYICRGYQNRRSWTLQTDMRALLRHALAGAGLGVSKATGIKSEKELAATLRGAGDIAPAVEEFAAALEKRDLEADVRALLLTRMPSFLYFDEYTTMEGSVSITRLQQSEDDLSPRERTALSLLRLAGVDTEEFTEATYEPRRAALEAAANSLTDEVFEYWSQNRDLSIDLDVDFRPAEDDENEIEPWLEIRVRNAEHRVTLNFAERSAGFVWFFSFLAAFSEYRSRQEPLVLLLDEPGLGLHAAAQGDLLRYINERLAPAHQLIYSTHSPFMIEPTRLDRVRAVEDIAPYGTRATGDVFGTTRDTVFPLQAALGYELSQTLFLGPNTLLVEGPSDLIYLQVVSEHLKSLKRLHLDDRWVIAPAGGIDKLPAFISLLGAQLNVVVLLDVAAGGNQRIDDLVKRKVISDKRLIALTKYTGGTEADIEDLFDEPFYYSLVEGAGLGKIGSKKVPPLPRVTRRVASVIGEYSHYPPARLFLTEQARLLSGLSPETLDRFEALFRDINALVE